MIRRFNDYPDYFYAGFFIRLFAFTTDVILIGALSHLFLFFLHDSLVKTVLSLSIYLLYFILMTKFTNGQTLGKMIFGIRVIAINEEKLSWTTILVREGFGRYLQKVLWIMYSLTIFTRYKQHVVDLLTDTSVVTENYLRLLESTTELKEEKTDEETVPTV
ncbi:MAG TPA: RDD family protein [Bacilli bacterium]|nr:RDD family protein [Bacilli bacterium]